MNNAVMYTSRVSLALLLLRIASSLTFLYYGSGILFGLFGGPGPVGFSAPRHWPLLVAYLVGLAEFGGGIAIITGFLFRLGAACVFIVMLGAILIVHLPHGFGLYHGGMEYALTELLMAAAFVLTGPGAYSLARWLPSALGRW